MTSLNFWTRVQLPPAPLLRQGYAVRALHSFNDAVRALFRTNCCCRKNRLVRNEAVAFRSFSEGGPFNFFAKASECTALLFTTNFVYTENVIISGVGVSFEAPKGSAVGRAVIFGYVHYIYILQSQKDDSFYTGYTTDLKARLKDHNTHGNKYSSTKAPYKLIWYCAFLNKKKALDFEKYLKQGSGFAFARKRLV